MEKAINEIGADFLAMGHYCQNKNNLLVKERDNSKDQSYFLYTIKSSILEKVLFPIGDLEKREVREIAKKALSTKDKGQHRYLLYW